MITRDSKASISGTAQSARQRLGEVIRYYREDRSITVRDVSRRCKVAAPLVEKWESGEQLPSTDEWKGLCRGVNRALNAFQELYTRARAEADAEARERAQTNMAKEHKTVNPTTKINTALGDKLAHVQIASAPMSDARTVKPGHAVTYHEPPLIPIRLVQNDEPAMATTPNKRAPRPPVPRGSMSEEQIARRADFVRNILRTRPHARRDGSDGILSLVRGTFGVGISPDTVEQIRDEVIAEMRASLKPEPPKATAPQPIASAPVERSGPIATQVADVMAAAGSSPDHERDLNAAVSMILEAIPNLQTFTIAIDDQGEASIDYQIRKVKIETVGGSFKVRR